MVQRRAYARSQRGKDESREAVHALLVTCASVGRAVRALSSGSGPEQLILGSRLCLAMCSACVAPALLWGVERRAEEDWASDEVLEHRLVRKVGFMRTRMREREGFSSTSSRATRVDGCAGRFLASVAEACTADSCRVSVCTATQRQSICSVTVETQRARSGKMERNCLLPAPARDVLLALLG
eukprot:4933860-Pleurochrysis_carterae.AAC.1